MALNTIMRMRTFRRKMADRWLLWLSKEGVPDPDLHNGVVSEKTHIFFLTSVAH